MTYGIKKSKKLENDYSKIKVKCQCGHTLIMPVYIDRMICTWCGQIVCNNTPSYFKYKIRKIGDYKR